MSEHFFFYLGLSFLTLHEMDAIRCREWRIFPGLSLLSDKIGHVLFVFAHLPLFYFIYWQLTYSQDIEAFMKGFNIFMIVHLLLHILFLKHKNNEFKDWISWSILITSVRFKKVIFDSYFQRQILWLVSLGKSCMLLTLKLDLK